MIQKPINLFITTSVVLGCLCIGTFLYMSHCNDKLVNVNETLTKELSDLRETNQTTTENHIKEVESYQEEIFSLKSSLRKTKKSLKTYKSYYEDTKDLSLKSSLYSVESIITLAKCVQAEAGDYDNHAIAQQIVTRVILNRILSEEFPNTIEDVIYQKVCGVPQFSVAYDGAMDKTVLDPRTLINVYKSLDFNPQGVPSDVLYFYDSQMKKDNWVKSRKTYKIVEGTVFCYESEGN